MKKIYEEAKPKMPIQKERILSALRFAGDQGVLNTELNNISFRYSDRLYQLRLEGYEFAVENVGDGLIKYTLIVEPQTKPAKVKSGIELVIDEIQSKYSGSVTASQIKDILNDLQVNIIRRPNTLKV